MDDRGYGQIVLQCNVEDDAQGLAEYAITLIDRYLKPFIKEKEVYCVDVHNVKAIDEACSSCVQINYEIINLCKGCVARGCYTNCPKNAVHFQKNGQAQIDHDACISCGICHQSCPYHAIVYIPVPCEESCPVKAISKDEFGSLFFYFPLKHFLLL